MISQSIYRYYFFGTCLRFLQDAKAGRPIGEPVGAEGWIRFNLNKFFEYLDEFEMHVTRRAATELRRFRDDIAIRPAEDRLSKEEANELSKLVSDLRKTLEAELQGYNAYIVTPKRLDVHRLLSDVPSLFSPGAYSKLNEIAKYDLQEAGKCIAFERPTAAAFHLLRATEAVVRDFYCTLVRRNRVRLFWGDMVSDLYKRRKAKAHENLLHHLDHIRVQFRNPTQHPEKIYDIQEVQDLWSLSADAVSRMASVIT
jgi:hypothetical protein